LTGTKSLRGTTLVEAPSLAASTPSHDSGCEPSAVTCRSPRLLPGEFGCPWLRRSAPYGQRRRTSPAMPGFHRRPALCDGLGQPTGPVQRTNNGGPEGIRTPDLLNAIEARCQLRHRPTLLWKAKRPCPPITTTPFYHVAAHVSSGLRRRHSNTSLGWRAESLRFGGAVPTSGC
jgi:hypothetical protein